ncbi:MAG: hypothetical protein KDH88_14455 [Chromatiales bacterium]|nr:hypothetical protein [Chromatiales bacterium]
MSDNQRFRIPSLYKKFLLIAIVLGPVYWLMFTEDGRRRTDLVFLYLSGEPSVALDLSVLGAAATEQQLREFLPDVQWTCEDKPTAFGARNCVARIGAFNDTPAHYLVSYFDEAKSLKALKMVYRRAYHAWLLSHFTRNLGKPIGDNGGVLRWTTTRGVVLMKSEISAADPEPSMIWLAAGER